MMPNQDQVLSLVRSLIGIGSGYAIGHGYFTADQVTMFSGVAATLVPLVWGLFAHTDSAKIAAVTALNPTTTPAVAAAAIATLNSLPDIRKIQTVLNPVNPAVAAAASDSSQTKVAPVP